MPGSILPFCSCLPPPWVVRSGCLCVWSCVDHPFGSVGTGSRGASKATAPVWAGAQSSGRPHMCLCPSWWHCHLLPAWRSWQLIQQRISFMSVMRSYLCFWPEHKAIAPQWLCWVHPTDALLVQNITTGGKYFQQTWFIHRLTKCRPQGWILM